MEPRPSQQNLDEEQERQAKPKGLPSTLAWDPEVVEQLKEQEEAKHDAWKSSVCRLEGVA